MKPGTKVALLEQSSYRLQAELLTRLPKFKYDLRMETLSRLTRLSRDRRGTLIFHAPEGSPMIETAREDGHLVIGHGSPKRAGSKGEVYKKARAMSHGY